MLQMQYIRMPNIKQIEGILWLEYFQAISLRYANNLLANFLFNILYQKYVCVKRWTKFYCQGFLYVNIIRRHPKRRHPETYSIFIYCLSFIIFDCVWIIPIVTEKPSLENNIMLLCREPEKVELWDIFWNN